MTTLQTTDSRGTTQTVRQFPATLLECRGPRELEPVRLLQVMRTPPPTGSSNKDQGEPESDNEEDQANFDSDEGGMSPDEGLDTNSQPVYKKCICFCSLPSAVRWR
ncbi:mCG1050986 [Mus musculus]|nr:mCG1050986 [Mus musculus]